jgi:hypothetical protein
MTATRVTAIRSGVKGRSQSATPVTKLPTVPDATGE